MSVVSIADFDRARRSLDELRAQAVCLSAEVACSCVGLPVDEEALERRLDELPGLRWRLDDLAPLPAPLQGCAELLERALRLIEDAVDALGRFEVARAAGLFRQGTELLAREYGCELQRALGLLAY